MVRIKVKNLSLVEAPDEQCFWVQDGKILRNLDDLQKALKEMSDETFRYHVNQEKNDFAKWVEEVLQDTILAKQLRQVKTCKAMLKRVQKRIEKYC